MEKITYNFKNRTAVVTGGAQGFGLDIANRFLKSEVTSDFSLSIKVLPVFNNVIYYTLTGLRECGPEGAFTPERRSSV